jgi:hypothetical protein
MGRPEDIGRPEDAGRPFDRNFDHPTKVRPSRVVTDHLSRRSAEISTE